MKNHSKKIVGAVISAVVTAILSVGYALIFVFIPDIPTSLKIGITVIYAIPVVVLVIVLTERIKEIRKGEEDDLSKYWLYLGQGVWNVRPC